MQLNFFQLCFSSVTKLVAFLSFLFSPVFSSAFPDPPHLIPSSPTGKRVRFEQMSTVLVKGQCFSRLEPPRRQSLPQIVLRYRGTNIDPLKSKFIRVCSQIKQRECREIFFPHFSTYCSLK